MQQPDLAMTLMIMDGYYLGNTCLILDGASQLPFGKILFTECIFHLIFKIELF